MTKVECVYDIFFSQIDDELFALLRPEVARRELHKYLIGAIAKFKTCKKDLTILGYDFSEMYIDLGESEIEIPENHLEGIEVIGEQTGIEYKKGIDWNLNTNRIEFEIPMAEPSKIYFYDNGYFEADLTNEEIFILAEGMIFYWLHPKLNREDNLRQMVTDSDFKKLSGANMLDKVIKLYEKNKRSFELDVIDYSYNGFGGFN